MDMNKAITKNSDDRKNSKKPKDFDLINPHMQVGSYIWGLVGTYVANQVNQFFKDQNKAEI